jgi:hypothetical protein
VNPYYDHDEVVNRIHYLRCACLVYRDIWIADSTIENWRRWYWAKKRYEAALAEGEYHIGMAGELREGEA